MKCSPAVPLAVLVTVAAPAYLWAARPTPPPFSSTPEAHFIGYFAVLGIAYVIGEKINAWRKREVVNPGTVCLACVAAVVALDFILLSKTLSQNPGATSFQSGQQFGALLAPGLIPIALALFLSYRHRSKSQPPPAPRA